MKLFNFEQKKGKRSKKKKKGRSRRARKAVEVRTYTAEEKLKIIQEFEVAQEIIAELEKIKAELGVSSPPKKKDVRGKADLNSDGRVDEADFEVLKKAFNSEPGDENWNPECDLDGDGEINLSDFGVLVEEYNK